MTEQVEMDGRHAAGIECDKGHGGNLRYAPVDELDGDYACQGCGYFRSAASIAAEQRRS